MSGPFGSPQWMYSSGFYPHEIGNSVRFDNNSYISRTPSSASNRKTFTWSAWVKRCEFAANQSFFSVGSSSSSVARIDWQFTSGNNIQLYFNPTGSSWIRVVTTTALYRDPSSWYHIVIAIDTTQATASNRTKLYVNGEQITAFTSDGTLAQDTDLPINNTVEHNIGRYQSDANAYLDSYITEVNFIDGTALTPASFGETKADTWIPKKYAGSYGSHDYYLDFATRATNPLDASGNGNNWTSTNVAATDWMLDSPTNNFATLNPIGPMRHGANYNANYGTAGNQTQGNLTITSTSSSYFNDTASTVFNNGDTGKWYYEIRNDQNHGNGGSGYLQFNIGGAYLWEVYSPATQIVNTPSGSHNVSTFSNGDIFMFAVDQDNGKGWFGKNGSWYTVTGTPDPAAGTNPHSTFSSIDFIGQVQIRSSTSSLHRTVTANFGQDSSFAGQVTAQGNTDANGLGDFYYAPPAGFLALCTANLPDPAAAFNPAVNNSPQDHFNTVLYTGNGSTDRDITGVGFQPDWVWIKKRNATKSHNLFDVVRGAGKMLETNSNIGDFTDTDRLNGFISDGFNLGNDNAVNNSGDTYVAWNWKAGGSGVSNTDGTITSTVSANTDAGFSIVTYTGNNTNAATVGHGLGKTPALLITKSRDTSTSPAWHTSHKSLAANYDVALDSTTAAWNPAGNGWHELTSASVFTLKNGTTDGTNVNKSGDRYIAYCFAEVEGFSKFGSFAGNGSADGPFVYTGFRPAFVICKKTSNSGLWLLTDNKRQGYNVNNEMLFPDDSGAGSIGDSDDFLSNGFKIRGASGSSSGSFNVAGESYIYIAFAEIPFKYANAR